MSRKAHKNLGDAIKTEPTDVMDFGLLKSYKIPILPYAIVQSEKEALAQAARIGYPIALKLNSKEFLHKSDFNALSLNIRKPETLQSEYSRLMGMASGDAGASVLVQAFRPGKIELIAGGRIDPQFGPVVMLGLGGIYTEIWRDIALRICPFDEKEAECMIRSLKMYPILAGARGGRPIDTKALARLLVGLCCIMQQVKPAELDINPLIIRDDGIWAADVRIIR